MPTPVADPPIILLRDFRVARPVAHTQAAAWRAALAGAVGRGVHVAAALSGLPANTGETVRVAYVRSPAACVLRVTVTLNQVTAAGQKCTVTATLAGATDLPDFDSAHGLVLDGSVALECPTAAERDPAIYERWLDVTALDTDAIHDVVVTTATSSGTPKGVRSITLAEVPRSALLPEVSP
jgi:hypothetical protein